MSRTKNALLLHRGDTVHRRFVPFTSSFRYKLFLIDLDIDRLAEAGRECRLFSTSGLNLFSFRRIDHAGLGNEDLRPWARAEFAKADVDITDLAVRLITLPRHLFYKFAPISLWLAETSEGEPRGILYEVRNTFGERHIYAARISGQWSRHEAPKSFHVSPFFDVSGTYLFSLKYEPDRLDLGITTRKDGTPVHLASLSTRPQTASDSLLLRTAVTMPFSTLGVSVGIHWEALKLWIKGAKYHSKPAKDKDGRTLAYSTGKDFQEPES